ncbi:MAG: hypothetical protein JWO12_2954 [Frankiales bacterium]|nr:hypothetical protein [Frankiales bacterium]
MDLLFPVVVIALVVGVIAEIRGQSWKDAAGYGIGLLAFTFLMAPLRAYRRQRSRAEVAPDEEFDLVHYRPGSKRQTH